MNVQRGEDEGEGIELSLGLSLNGKFGVDPLRRSLSISPDLNGTGGPWVPLSRTYSLPDEDSRKRKEVQMIRRMELKRRRVEKIRNVNGPPPLSSQGSSGSGSRSGSWSSSEFDGLSIGNAIPFPGINRSTEVKSPQSVQSLDQNEHKSLPPKLQTDVGKLATVANTNPLRSSSDAGEMVRNVLADMPCVSTKANGPDGKRIEGFLYRFKKGEEVRIVCVCHGSFLTPAEFIKHAGGGDVEHPLRHIIVNPSSFF